MRLDYGTLISFSPLELQCGCSIRSPLLSEISELTFCIYNSYLASLLMDVRSYYRGLDSNNFDYFSKYTDSERNLILQVRKEYEALADDEKENILPIDVLSFDPKLISNLAEALSFFIGCDVHYSHSHKSFIHKEDGKITCAISRNIFSDIVDIILQRNGINRNTPMQEKPKFKSQLAKKLYYRAIEAESKRDKNIGTDKNMEIPNIISSVAARHPSLNIINIWDITIYQLYDQFQRLQNNNLYDIQSMSVAAWGDEKNKFDAAQWYKNLNHGN